MPFLPHPSFLDMSVICSAAGAVHMQYPKRTCEIPHGFCCSPSDAEGAQVQWPLACTIQMHEKNRPFLRKFGPAVCTAVFSLAWDLFQALVTWGHTTFLDRAKTPKYGSWFSRILLSCYLGFFVFFFSVYVFGACMWACIGTSMGQGRRKTCSIQWVSVGSGFDVLAWPFLRPSSTDQLFKAI